MRVTFRRALILLAALSIGAGATFSSPVDAQGAPANSPIVVTSTTDQPDQNGADGVCRTAANVCTLRAAIQQANYNVGSDTITFNISGNGIKTITLITSLPTLNDPTGGTTIDGYTQSGASPNTAANGSNADIQIQINGPNSSSAIVIESAENTIRGLAVYDSLINIEVRYEAADGNRIIGNFIGTNAAGSFETTLNSDGILINQGPDQNVIGTPDRADRNVVSGNRGRGIRMNHGETSQNKIQNNVIGLRPSGTDNLQQGIGIDIQWWTWGNLIGGDGANEGNVISGNNRGGGGVDISHMAANNLVIGNYIGTSLNGRNTTSYTENWRGIILKDNPENNYFARNTVGGNDEYAIWHKHNYTGFNAFVDNRIGVGTNGSSIGNDGNGMLLRGHDDIYHGNTFANIGGDETILITNTSQRTGHESWPDEQTVRNTVRQGTFYNNGDVPIEFGSTCCPHPNEDTPRIVGLGPGQVNGDQTCAGCEVEVYLSGTVNADGSLSPGNGTTGLGWIGTVTADNSGSYSLASPLITAGTRISVAGITPSGEVSNFSTTQTVPAQGSGLINNPDQPNAPTPAPAAPPLPPDYVPRSFDCSVSGATLSWDDAGASAYYVFATTAGVETYLGGHSSTSLTVPAADSYRVEHWVIGVATNAVCDGPGGGGGSFDCSVSGATLSWDNAGASEYYVFATTAGVEIYLGGHSSTSLTVPAADSYRVEHWAAGPATNATCDGPGGGGGSFDCSVSGATLSWDNAGASEYYVFATTAGVETYLGGHSSTSLTVPAADSYRVEHWAAGPATNATCDGGGGQVFSCSVSNGTLSWDDAGAAEYYVFATTGGAESYLGGHTATSLSVSAADSYRVEHWITGQATNAICSG